MVKNPYRIDLNEAVAAAMMLGEVTPFSCLDCKGTGIGIRLFGQGVCLHCRGNGVRHMGAKTRAYFTTLREKEVGT